jgi:hypothetical protein
VYAGDARAAAWARTQLEFVEEWYAFPEQQRERMERDLPGLRQGSHVVTHTLETRVMTQRRLVMQGRGNDETALNHAYIVIVGKRGDVVDARAALDFHWRHVTELEKLAAAEAKVASELDALRAEEVRGARVAMPRFTFLQSQFSLFACYTY